MFLNENSRDPTTRNKAGTGSREPAQPGCPWAKSSFHPFQRMPPQLPSLLHRALQHSPPMEHMPPMALFIWSTLSWLSCKYWSNKRIQIQFFFILYYSFGICHVVFYVCTWCYLKKMCWYHSTPSSFINPSVKCVTCICYLPS